MKNRHKIEILLVIIGIVFLMYFIIGKIQTVQAISKYGSRSDEVKQIQTKLKNWGYYTGSVDGIYGSSTWTAVKKIKKKNGLKVDGIAGKSTLKAMGIFSSSSSSLQTQIVLNSKLS